MQQGVIIKDYSGSMGLISLKSLNSMIFVYAVNMTLLVQVSDDTHNHATVLQQAIQACIPCPGEIHIRQVRAFC